MFKALLLESEEQGVISKSITELTDADLPDGGRDGHS